jgi:hypothetical protein
MTTILPKPTPERISPERALILLSTNHPENRQLDYRKVRELAVAMIDGSFQGDTDTIKISTEGRVIDGQHRLWAVVNAYKDIDLYVLRDVDLTLPVDWWAIRCK